MAKENTKPFTIFVEGNIGSGKTTFLKHFAALDNVVTLAEPVDRWREVRGENFLVRCLVYEISVIRSTIILLTLF